MDTNFRRKLSAVLLAALFLGWGAVLAFADSSHPHGLNVVLHDLHEEPSVVTFDTDAIGMSELESFAKDLCSHKSARVELVRRFPKQLLLGRQRAHVFCWSFTP